VIFLIASATADTGRAMADPWPTLTIFRELELRGHVPLQPNEWPLRTGRMLAALPDNLPDRSSQMWADELRAMLGASVLHDDSISFIIEPGVEGILNIPRDKDDRFYPNLRVGGGMAKGSLEGFVTYVVNLRWAREPNYRGRKWSGFAGRPDQVYLRADGERWGVQFGKDYLSWGEGMILGREADPFDRLDYHADIGPLRLTGFAGWLDPIHYFIPVEDTLLWEYAHRYLSGHRLEFVSKRFSIAMYETMLYGGLGRAFEVVYAVPFYWFHAQQLNIGIDDNTALGGDFQVLLPPVRVSGELLVDDIQVEKKVQADEEPPLVGWALQTDVGATVLDRWLTLSARYEGVTNWTYNQSKRWNRYIYMNKPIGSPHGNDYDRITLGARLMASPALIVNLGGFYHRKGEGRIDAYWSEPWMDIDGPYSEPFPTGVVEKTTGLVFEASGSIWPRLFWNADVEFGTADNFSHELGAKSDYWEVGIGVSGGLYWSAGLR